MSVLVIGHHYWGHAAKLAEAKRNFTGQGGRLSSGYTIVDFGPGLTFRGVDQLGRVFWDGEGEPFTRQVAPRRSRNWMSADNAAVR